MMTKSDSSLKYPAAVADRIAEDVVDHLAVLVMYQEIAKKESTSQENRDRTESPSYFLWQSWFAKVVSLAVVLGRIPDFGICDFSFVCRNHFSTCMEL